MLGWVCLILLMACGVGQLIDMELLREIILVKNFFSFVNQHGDEYLFQKKPVHLGSWMHLATKRYYMIDFVVMRTYQRKYCLDMQVIRGAKCWTDHCLGRARLRVMLPRTAVTSKHPYALPFAVHKFAKPELCDSYVRSLEQRSSGWSLPPGSTAEKY